MAEQRRTQTGEPRRSSYRPASPSQARAPRKRVVLTGPPALSKTIVRVVGMALLVAAGLAVGSLFPKYTLDAAPSSTSTSSVLLHVVPAGSWLVGGVLMLTGRGALIRTGNALAAGSSLVTLGITIVEVSKLIGSGESLGAGFWLSVGSVLLALAAALVGTLTLRRSTSSHRPLELRLWTLIPTAVVGAVITVAYTQSWQHERISDGSNHKSTAANVPGQFDDRWEAIAGQVLILVFLVAFPVLASQWRRRRPGGAYIVGAAAGFAAYALPTYVAAQHPLQRFSAAVVKELKKEKVLLSVHLLGWYWVVVAGAALVAVIGIVLLAVKDDPIELNLPRQPVGGGGQHRQRTS